MTRYLERVIAGEMPAVQEWNDHLVAFHRTFPDVTGEALGAFRTDDGATSYELAARRLRAIAPNARRILDVGCGDGRLLELLDRTYHGENLGRKNYDAIVAHLSLTIMSRLGDALARVAAALGSGGVFLAITEDLAAEDSILRFVG